MPNFKMLKAALVACCLLMLSQFALSSFASAQGFVAQRDGLTVRYSNPNDAAQLEQVFKTWQNAKRDLSRLGLTLPNAVLVAAQHAEDFKKRTGQAAFVAAITTGTGITTQRLGALAQRGTLPSTIRHECFHLAQPKRLPRWLAEGLARHFAQEDQRDPRRTTLETSTVAQLEAALLAQVQKTRQRAYWEATRRAKQELKKSGWLKLLARYQ